VVAGREGVGDRLERAALACLERRLSVHGRDPRIIYIAARGRKGLPEIRDM
jgi:hypothetical protein